jgi:hypothetical protein
MKKKKELIDLLEQVVKISDLNIKNEMFDFEDFGYIIEDYIDQIKELED